MREGLAMNSILGSSTLGGVLRETYRIYRRNFLRLLAIVAIVQVSMAILVYVLMAQFTITQEKIGSVTSFIPMGIIILAYSILAVPLMVGALIHAVSEQYLRQTIDIGQAYRFAWGRLGALIGAMILVALVILGIPITLTFIGSTLRVGPIFMVAGFCILIYFLIRWAFIWQAALLENIGPIAALSRSSALVKNNWWRVLGIMLVLFIITTVTSAILGIIPVLGNTMGGILSTPIVTIGSTLLYYDLRVRKEGYSSESLEGELNIEPGLSCTKVWEGLSTEAFTLYQQGQLPEAAERLQDALKVAEEALGPGHLDVATILSNLAALYRSQGRYSDSEHLYKRALTIREKTYGPDHPDVVAVLENMAKCCREMGEEDAAEKLEARVRKIKVGM
jgi:tetratricopeptide (TPR) repeat protein